MLLRRLESKAVLKEKKERIVKKYELVAQKGEATEKRKTVKLLAPVCCGKKR